jgi:tRNA A-37 threonylcarbamoyl transferase component Bud32
MMVRVRWVRTGYEDAVARLRRALEETPWPGPPAGFVPLAPPRPMRGVFAGWIEGPAGREAVVLKWHRRDTALARAIGAVRVGRGPREARVLRALEAAGVSAPLALACGDGGPDFLVTRRIEGLAPLPPIASAPRDAADRVAALLARAHEAGLRHRDLHASNLGLAGGRPVLVDLGRARAGRPVRGAALVEELARARHGLLEGATRAARLRLLVRYLEARGETEDRSARHALARRVEARARRVARRYRAGRDRRATRSGKHFEAWRTSAGAPGLRRRDTTDDAWKAWAEAALAANPRGAAPLKPDGGVLRVEGPSGPVVLKRYGPVARGRLPRALRAFRRAHALAHRHLLVPTAHLAVAAPDGSSVLVSRLVDAPDLARCVRSAQFARWPHARRRAVLEAVGRALRALHDAEVGHRDLKAPNLLVEESGGRPRVWIADLDGARVRRGPIPWARRAHELARLDASVPARASDRLRVLRAYLRVLPSPPLALRRFTERVARSVRRKRGPTGEPR